MKAISFLWPMALAATSVLAAPQITITHTPVPRAASPPMVGALQQPWPDVRRDTSTLSLSPSWSLSTSLPTNTLPTNTLPTNTLPTNTLPTNTLPTATLPTSVLFPTSSFPFGRGKVPFAHDARVVAGATRGPPPPITAKATTTISYTSVVDFSTTTSKKKVF
ncbi:hypothetical protein B0T19DRAFT_199068 [Cercophora scortea]|uniref:Uncharacterized protein n=1 Tax=Cercophora scortea TaxID=314031 RepID=A0AAE0IDH7_9PEZI|nr:hypothetical protein B0T19DRAFT_199068 [Cercophora scortea]